MQLHASDEQYHYVTHAAINIDGGTFDSIPIASTAAVALRKIDRWLEALSGCET